MKTHEDELMEYEERAAIMEYDGGMTRTDAEQHARKIIFGDSKEDNDPTIPPCTPPRDYHGSQ